MQTHPYFSVIIPALNEEYLLPRLLDSLSKQSFKDFEVILVDANSTDKTVEITHLYSKSFPLILARTKEKNISNSRNTGARNAKSNYLVFIDADNFIHPNFLKDIQALLEKKSFDMIIPAVEPDIKTPAYRIICSFVNLSVTITKWLGFSHTTGGNLVIKRDAFKVLNGFDETIFVSEDQDIVKRANKRGFSVTVVRNPKVVFCVRRFEKEGPTLLLKYFVSAFYTATFGKITKKIYNYPMGGDYYIKKG